MREAMMDVIKYPEEEKVEKYNSEREIYPEVEAIINENPKLQEAIKLYKEKCDEYTVGHIFGDANKSALLSDYLDLDEEHKKFFIQAALLHDIGKTDTDISKVVRSDKRPLSEEEIEIIHQHVRKSIEYAKEIGMPKEVLQIIGAHHEENNGDSYPRNSERRKMNSSSEKDINNRIEERREEPSEEVKKIIHAFAIIDKLDAMFYQRPYREEMMSEEAGCEILRKTFHNNEEDIKMMDLLLEEREKELHYKKKSEQKQ